MMRICCPVLGISSSSTLGGEIHDREVLKGLSRLGVKIEVLLPKNRPFPRIKNLNVNFAPIKHIFPPYIFNFFVFFYLLKTFKKEKFDLIRVHNPYFVGPAAALFKLFYRVPTVAVYHHLEKNFLKNLIDKILIKRWETIIVPSKFTKKEIIKKFKVKPSKIHVFYSGVDKTLRKEKKNRNLVKKYHLKDKKVLLFLSSLTPRKNPEFALRVLAKLEKKAILVIAGTGLLGPKLKILTKRLKLNNKIVLAGAVKKKDKSAYFNLADVFLFPSKKEGFGMVAAEAMLCEKCVIANKSASLPEIIKDGETGFLLKLNVKKWAEKIDKLLAKPKLRQKMGKRARASILKRFSWQRTTKDNYRLYQKLINESS